MTTVTEAPMQIQLPEEAAEATTSDLAQDEDTSGVNWASEAGEMGDEEGLETVEGDVEVLAEAAAGEVKNEQVLDEETPPVAPVVAETAPAPVPVVTEQPQPQAVTPAPAPIPAPEPFDMAKWEKEQLGNLESVYAISPEDAEKLNTEPEIILPKLAANMHLMVTKSLLTAVQGMIPEYLAMHTQQASVEQEARSSFYSVHPELNDPKYEAAVLQVGKMFRAANPTAPREVAIKTIGDMVKQSLGITVPQTVQTSPTPATPAARPFTPAKGGGQRAAPKTANIWNEMISDD